jgi:hypothetical protein
MFKREIKPLAEGMVDSISKSINKLQYVEEKADRPADRADGDVKPQDISGEEEVKSDASAKKAPARKGDQAQADGMEKVKEEVEVEEAMDPVNPVAVKKKFDDRKDKDIDNDGDTDSSDEYLHKRRKAISKALKSKKPKASVEESAELEGLEEANMSRVAKELEAYARKNGGIDKMDFMKAAMMMKKGQTAQLKKFVDDLDTEPREKILSLMDKDADRRKEYKAAQKKMREEVELDEKVNTKGIQKAVDDGKSMDVIMTMFANKRTTNTDEIRKVVKDYMWKKRMKKEEVELDEAAPKISKGTSKGSIMARGIRGKGMKKFDVDVKVDNGKFSFRITDESGKFQTVDIKQAARMLGEQVVWDLTQEAKDLDEAKNYEIKGGKVHISKANFRKVHKDYKNATKGKERMMALDPKTGGTTSFEVVFTEAKSDYTIYHKTFSSAVQHAEEVAKKRGFEVDSDEWDRKVAMGPRKPGKGKTNSYIIGLMKGGKPTRKKLHMQVYYDEGRYELNMYID